jgi:hypothetical protein
LSRVITGDLATFDFFLFPKMKLKLKWRRFDIIEEIQAESQRQKRTSRKRSKNGDDGTGIYMREGDGGRQTLWWVLLLLQRQSGIFWIPTSYVVNETWGELLYLKTPSNRGALKKSSSKKKSHVCFGLSLLCLQYKDMRFKKNYFNASASTYTSVRSPLLPL